MLKKKKKIGVARGEHSVKTEARNHGQESGLKRGFGLSVVCGLGESGKPA